MMTPLYCRPATIDQIRRAHPLLREMDAVLRLYCHTEGIEQPVIVAAGRTWLQHVEIYGVLNARRIDSPHLIETDYGKPRWPGTCAYDYRTMRRGRRFWSIKDLRKVRQEMSRRYPRGDGEPRMVWLETTRSDPLLMLSLTQAEIYINEH